MLHAFPVKGMYVIEHIFPDQIAGIIAGDTEGGRGTVGDGTVAVEDADHIG
jgi:hypothetical protein